MAESKLEQVGYGYVYTDDTIVTLSPSNDHCVNLIIDVVDLEDSVSFRIDLIWDDVTIKSKKYQKISVSNAITILTNVLENIKEIDMKTHHNITVSDAIRILTSMLKHVEEIYTKAQKDLKLFEVTLYPVNVGLEEAIKYIEELLICCDFEPQRKGVWRIDRVGSMLKVHVDKGKRIIEIFICGDRIDWELIYRREINIKNNKELCEEIKSIIDKFKQLYLPPEVAVETFFKEL